jgi:pimeloyl-ACP methyl ester carboxylesterase
MSYVGVAQLPWLPEQLALARNGAGLRKALLASGLPAEVAERYVERMLKPGALAGALAWYRGVPLSAGYNPGRISVPTGFLWGAKDLVFTRQACELTGEFVTGPYIQRRLPDAGHWIPETRPDDVAQIVLETVARV